MILPSHDEEYRNETIERFGHSRSPIIKNLQRLILVGCEKITDYYMTYGLEPNGWMKSNFMGPDIYIKKKIKNQ